jgi:hypothetical protein
MSEIETLDKERKNKKERKKKKSIVMNSNVYTEMGSSSMCRAQL